MPNSLTGFAHQSLYVGVGPLSKQFDNRGYTTRFKSEDEVPDYHSTVKPSVAPERKLIYQAFALLNTHVLDEKRTEFSMTYVTSIRQYLTVNLERTVLENSMKSAPVTSADEILASLDTIYQETIDKEIGVSEEEELEEEDVNGTGEDLTTSITSSRAARGKK